METFLFKVPLADFIDARLSIDWPWRYYILAVLIIAAIVYFAFGFLSLRRTTAGPNLVINWLIKTAIFSLLLLVFLQPSLRLETSEPAPNRLAVLIDDSISMTIADGGNGQTRAEQLLTEFGVSSGETSNALKEKFEVEHYSYGADVQRLQEQQQPDFSDPRSDSGRALQSFVSKGISTLVLVSDGHNNGLPLDDSLDSLIAAGIKVFTVGVGQQRFDGELSIDAINLPSQVLTDDTVFAELEIAHRGLNNETVELIVEEDGAILTQQQLKLDTGKSRTKVAIPLNFESAGHRALKFRLPTNSEELIEDNNSIERSINVVDERFRVLHFEGEPRFEVKFIRRALTDDANIRLTSLIRTADSKFFRIGLEDEDELASGFPTEREELYRFDAIILGSVDRSLMSDQQLDLLRDFVSLRGGGLLLLGGAGAYAEGGYTDSVLEDMLPVQLEAPSTGGVTRVKVSPTLMGQQTELLLDVLAQPLTGESDNSVDAWQRLPELTIVNPLRRAKPGATVMLEGYNSNRDRFIVLATHRYGYGMVAALPVRDTWRWQINAEIAADDTTHESLWRRLLRSLVTGARQKLEVSTPTQTGVVDQTFEVAVETLDTNYAAHSTDTEVSLQMTSPSGRVQTLRANPIAGKPGLYQTNVSTPEPGRYDFQVTAPDANNVDVDANASSVTDSSQRPAVTHVDVELNGNELRNAERDTAALRHIAERTGGAYFDIDDLDALDEQIDATQQTRQVSRRVSLADAPALLALLVFLIAMELLLRRRWRLA